jgi:hypothetical protein
MRISGPALSAAALVAMLALATPPAQATMNDGIFGPAAHGKEARRAIPASLVALGLDISAPATVAAAPSGRLPAGTVGPVDDDVIGAN